MSPQRLPGGILKHVGDYPRACPKVSFPEPVHVEVFNVPAYSWIYGCHPRTIVATATGWKRVSPHAHPFTGKTAKVMKAREDELYSTERRSQCERLRAEALNSVMVHGPAWDREEDPDPSVHEVIASLTSQHEIQKQIRKAIFDGELEADYSQGPVAAVRTPSAKPKFQGRQGAKQVKKFEQLVGENEKLTPAGATLYRALSARCNYLAQDRPDISYSAKELCRDFAVPSTTSLKKLTHRVKYLAGCPRLVYKFPWQARPEISDTCVDTDFAGCRVTRRSTSGGVTFYGAHCVRHWSTTQSTISLSSGEAELNGLCKGAAQANGIRSMAADLGLTWRIRILTDATAAMGMSRRLGIGKIRHLDTSLLWIQAKVRSGDVLLDKIAGSENPADALTKYLAGPQLRAHLARMGLVVESGRAASAPKVATEV